MLPSPPRLLAAAFMLVALSGCAAPPLARVGREPPLSYPPSARERLVRLAIAEWHEWGDVVSEPGSPRPFGPGPETTLSAFPRVLAYWRAVEDEGGAIARNRARYAAALSGAATTPWSEPAWSAAFVSWVMRSAGVDAREFPGSASHAFYLDGLLADARDFPDLAPFVPHGVAERAPLPGDLVCADRARRPLRDWRERWVETGQFRPMHCDIVVRSGPFSVDAVGGNIADAVTLSRFAADAAGYLVPRPRGEPIFFAVMENRLGLLPPFGSPTGSPEVVVQPLALQPPTDGAPRS